MSDRAAEIRAFMRDDPRTVMLEAFDEYHDAGMTSGADACEHYLAAIARLLLWEFAHRHIDGSHVLDPSEKGTDR